MSLLINRNSFNCLIENLIIKIIEYRKKIKRNGFLPKKNFYSRKVSLILLKKHVMARKLEWGKTDVMHACVDM